jgi:hypothetical protein
MVIPGVGVGAGAGSNWASADDIAPIASAKAIATARTSLRPAPVLPASEGRDAQRMNSNPTGSLSRHHRIPCPQADLPPVRRERQSLGNPVKERLTGVVVRLPQVASPRL